ncbi:MAG: hypothetical protein NVS9B10_15020 [Nevskia sp.]
MPRARNIKPGFFKNEELVTLPFEQRLLFIGLWILSDREGRLEDRPKRIRMEVFPADNVDVDAGLNALAAAGFITRYVAEGQQCIQVDNFLKHQNPHHKEPASTIPKPEASPGLSTSSSQHEPKASPVPASDSRAMEGGVNPADSLIPDSLIPDSLIPDSLIPEPEKLPTSSAEAEMLQQNRDVIYNLLPSPDQTHLQTRSPPTRLSDDWPGFDEFYKAYPKKQGPKKAREAWAKLKPNELLRASIARAVTAWSATSDWQKEGGKFVPMPATWINGGRWEDEVPSASTESSRVGSKPSTVHIGNQPHSLGWGKP